METQAQAEVKEKTEQQTNNTQEKTENKSTTPNFSGVFVCSTPQCGKASTLQCPTCVKLELPPAFFCSQQCFKEFWGIHKLFHQKSNK